MITLTNFILIINQLHNWHRFWLHIPLKSLVPLKPPVMKLTLFAFLLYFILPGISKAQTYTISSNNSWTSVVGSTNCLTCTFNITPGITFTLDFAGTCGSCIFNNGILNVTQNLTCQGCTFNANTITAAGTQLNLQSTTNTLNNTTLSVTGTGSVLVTAGISLTNSTLTFSNSSYFNMNGGSFTASSSLLYFNGNSYFTATSGPVSLQNNSNLVAGDGTLASTAYLNFNGPSLQVYGASLVKVSNQNNYYMNWGSYTYFPSSGPSASISTLSNNFNCNYGAVSGYANSCVMNYAYGCATLNGSGLSACSLLALADMHLAATATGPGQVALVFTDGEPSTADHYMVDRNSGNNEWKTISAIPAGGYTSGDYRYTDADAPAGSIKYRIGRIDQKGRLLYSPIATVAIDQFQGSISIHPNPATGGAFYVSTPYSSEMVVKVFTLTGQLLYRTDLKGRTQYAIRLPAQAARLDAVVVQTFGQAGTRTFTVLVR
jgi:hypothetical protein